MGKSLMDNLETLATLLGTQDTEKKQYKTT